MSRENPLRFQDTPSFKALSGREINNKYSEEEFKKDISKIIAFYLPQYHEVQQNSEWWGEGFTDWVNVAKAREIYPGHYQPHIPGELGFYDASQEVTLQKQSDLAKQYGVHGFAFYWYWFDGFRILEKPIDVFYNSKIDFNYCFCWANEAWARNWDGNPSEILLDQIYSEGFEKQMVNDLAKYWQDQRYITVDERPLLIIYRINHIPNVKKVISKIRSEAVDQLKLDPYIIGVDFYDMPNEVDIGLDGIVEFPPHKFWGVNNHKQPAPEFNKHFRGSVIDYKKVVLQSIMRVVSPDRTLFKTCFPSWDNTARRQNESVIIENTNPKLFEFWLSALRQYTRERLGKSNDFIFINAWNEWAEGAHLEPDRIMGRAFLEAIRSSENYLDSIDYLDASVLKRNMSVEDYVTNSNVYFDSNYYISNRGKKEKAASFVFNTSPYLFRLIRFFYRKFLESKNR